MTSLAEPPQNHGAAAGRAGSKPGVFALGWALGQKQRLGKVQY